MNDELADFLGPDNNSNNDSGTESDAESDRGGSQAPAKNEGLRNGGSSLKRSRHAEDSDDGEEGVNGEEEEMGVSRKKTRVYKDDEGDDEDLDISGKTLVADEGGFSDEEGDLEAELEAAFAMEAEGEGREEGEAEGGEGAVD